MLKYVDTKELKNALAEFEYYEKHHKFEMGATSFQAIALDLESIYGVNLTIKEVAFELYKECTRRWMNCES